MVQVLICISINHPEELGRKKRKYASDGYWIFNVVGTLDDPAFPRVVNVA
jgi:hypothetical protein